MQNVALSSSENFASSKGASKWPHAHWLSFSWGYMLYFFLLNGHGMSLGIPFDSCMYEQTWVDFGEHFSDHKQYLSCHKSWCMYAPACVASTHPFVTALDDLLWSLQLWLCLHMHG